jgi:serine/threonine protein kinase
VTVSDTLHPDVGPADAPERYELIERKAAGGEGEVWKARESIGGEPFHYAVKIIDGGEQSGTRLDALRMQAALATHLEHPALVKVREVFLGPPPAGVPGAGERLYFVMKWIEGRSLQDALERGDVRGLEVLKILEPVADALDYLHSGRDTNGSAVLHRDVKPDNILIANDGRVYLVDFGLVRLRATTSTSRIFGTAPFMAPESMVRGEFTSATDRYALGATVYYALAHEMPVPGNEERMRERLAAALGPGHDRVIRGVLAMLAGTPDRRPASAGDWVRALRNAPPETSQTMPTVSPALVAPPPTYVPTVGMRPPPSMGQPVSGPGFAPPPPSLPHPPVSTSGPQAPYPGYPLPPGLTTGPMRYPGAPGRRSGTGKVFAIVGSILAVVVVVCIGLMINSILRFEPDDGLGNDAGPGNQPTARRSIDRASPPPPITALEPALLSVADIATVMRVPPSEVKESGASDAGAVIKGGLAALELCSEKPPIGTDAIAQSTASYFSFSDGVLSYPRAASSIAGFYGDHAKEYMTNLRAYAQRCGYQEFAAPGIGEDAFGVFHPEGEPGYGLAAMVFARVGQVVIVVGISAWAHAGTYQAEETKLAAAMVARIPK